MSRIPSTPKHSRHVIYCQCSRLNQMPKLISDVDSLLLNLAFAFASTQSLFYNSYFVTFFNKIFASTTGWCNKLHGTKHDRILANFSHDIMQFLDSHSPINGWDEMDQLYDLRDHPISYLLTSTCVAFWRAVYSKS